MLPPSAGTSFAIAHHLNVEHWAIGNWALIPAVDAALFHCQKLNRVNINVGAHAFRERFGNVERANTIGGERWRSIHAKRMSARGRLPTVRFYLDSPNSGLSGFGKMR